MSHDIEINAMDAARRYLVQALDHLDSAENCLEDSEESLGQLLALQGAIQQVEAIERELYRKVHGHDKEDG